MQIWKMKEIEIIDGLPLSSFDPKEELYVEDGAIQAISKINSLIESNDSKEKIIENLNRTINKLNEDIENLHYINKEQQDNITNLINEKNTLDSNYKELEIIDKNKDLEIEKYKKEKVILIKYKENYDKIIGFLAKNEKKIEKD